jgi:hypothetical protein
MHAEAEGRRRALFAQDFAGSREREQPKAEAPFVRRNHETPETCALQRPKAPLGPSRVAVYPLGVACRNGRRDLGDPSQDRP